MPSFVTDNGSGGGAVAQRPGSTSGEAGAPAIGDSGTTNAVPKDASPDGAPTPPPPPAVQDPCPNLPIPGNVFNRGVVFREWSPTAVGDGSYFADQAPWRLGFNRIQGNVWIVKFRTEANTYRGRVSAYGDSSGGIAWVSDSPTDATFALQNHLVGYEVHGGGSLDFIVVKDDADANKIATDPAFASDRNTPKLRGDHCYYLGFENVASLPPSPLTTAFWSTADDCGTSTGGTSCYYLAMDLTHYLHVPTTGQIMAGNVIPGLTH